MFTFNKNYFALTLILFIVEVLIALYVHDKFIRPYFGDVLVVVLLYCGMKSFLKISVWKAAVIVLAFSFLIEFTQYINLISKLGLKDSGLARAVLGTYFSWEDIVCYAAGIVLIISVEKAGIYVEPKRFRTHLQSKTNNT